MGSDHVCLVHHRTLNCRIQAVLCKDPPKELAFVSFHWHGILEKFVGYRRLRGRVPLRCQLGTACYSDYWQRVTQSLRPLQFTVDDDALVESSPPPPAPQHTPTQCSHGGHWLVTQRRSLPQGSLWAGALDGQRGFHSSTLSWLPSRPCFPCPPLLVLPGITFHVNCCYLVTKSRLTLWARGLCGPPGSSVRGISQASRPEWVTTSFSRGSSWPGGGTHAASLAGAFFTTEPPGKAAPCNALHPRCSQPLPLEEPDIKVFLTKSPKVDSAGAGSQGKAVNSQPVPSISSVCGSGSVPSGMLRQEDKMAAAASDSVLAPEDLKPAVLGGGRSGGAAGEGIFPQALLRKQGEPVSQKALCLVGQGWSHDQHLPQRTLGRRVLGLLASGVGGGPGCWEPEYRATLFPVSAASSPSEIFCGGETSICQCKAGKHNQMCL